MADQRIPHHLSLIQKLKHLLSPRQLLLTELSYNYELPAPTHEHGGAVYSPAQKRSPHSRLHSRPHEGLKYAPASISVSISQYCRYTKERGGCRILTFCKQQDDYEPVTPLECYQMLEQILYECGQGMFRLRGRVTCK